MAAEFDGYGGGSRLAKMIGVSASTASNLLSGKPSASLIKIAAFYGYESDEDGAWIKSQHQRDPRDVGYRHRGTEAVLEDLRALMSQPRGKRPRTSDVARRAGVSQSTLRGVMAKAHIRLRSEDRS